LMALLLLAITYLAASTLGAPEQVSLNYGSLPSEMVAMWTTVNADSSSTFCEFGTAPDNLDNVVVATRSSYYMASSNYTSPIIFKAVMTGLTAGNKIYYYRVGSPSLGYSNVFSFKSNPGFGASVTPVTFHLLGDVGQTENSISTLEQIVEVESSLTTFSGGIVSMGDLSYANGNQPLWDSFGNMRQFAASQIPMFSITGNHEWFDSKNYDFTAFQQRFDYPLVNGKKELYYSFNVGLAHWVMVSGYCQEMHTVVTQPCLSADSEQMNVCDESFLIVL